MTIKTKYSINDNVFFLSENKIHKGHVITIIITVPQATSKFMVDNNMDGIIIEYRIYYGLGETYKLYEHQVFPTKEELIKSL